ncbi:MAG: hypothetical protein DRQ43_04165 [Gammaproteobacteria bacterium]|nr:MAG: hypothetical protein DRQ43_04165 [Gammaproteobacteria bacterium]
MPTHKQLVVEVPSTTRANGSSDTEALKQAYPGSPLYNNVGGEPSYLTDESVEEFFAAEVSDGEVDDGGHTFGTQNRDYVDSPNLEEVVTGGGGLPGSPYAPNVASPPEGQNPADIPEEGAAITVAAKGGGGAFQGDGLTSPSDTSTNIARQRIGTIMFGDSNPSS